MWTVGHKRDQVGGDVCKTHQQRGCWMFIHLWAPFYLHRQESSAWFRILWFTLATSWLPQAPQNYTCPTLDHYKPAIKSPAKSALVVLVGRWSSSLHRTWHQKLLWRIKAKILNVHFKCHHILQWGKENIGKPEKKRAWFKNRSYKIIYNHQQPRHQWFFRIRTLNLEKSTIWKFQSLLMSSDTALKIHNSTHVPWAEQPNCHK